MKMSNSIVIRRPLEEVFAFMSNIEHEVQWRPNVMEVKVTSGLPLRQGSTYLYVVKMMNRQMRTEGKFPPLNQTAAGLSRAFREHSQSKEAWLLNLRMKVQR